MNLVRMIKGVKKELMGLEVDHRWYVFAKKPPVLKAHLVNFCTDRCQNNWQERIQELPVEPGGFGGCCYFIRCIGEEVFNESVVGILIHQSHGYDDHGNKADHPGNDENNEEGENPHHCPLGSVKRNVATNSSKVSTNQQHAYVHNKGRAD